MENEIEYRGGRGAGGGSGSGGAVVTVTIIIVVVVEVVVGVALIWLLALSCKKMVWEHGTTVLFCVVSFGRKK